MAKKPQTVFVCMECGYESPKWMGQCICGAWNRFSEEKPLEPASVKNGKPSQRAVKLGEIQCRADDRIITGIGEFDRVMGGGIVKDSITILTSRPGGGKSSLALALAGKLGSQGYRVLYASGEESENQIKSRSLRIVKNMEENVWILAGGNMDDVITHTQQINPNLVIIDSIQTFSFREFESRAGSPTQTMACAEAVLDMAKGQVQRAVIMISQQNKNDEIAGLRALEHMVDTVLVIDGEDEEELRGLSVSKNRFGSTWDRGFFAMTEEGMVPIDNPSGFFMTNRNTGVIGSGMTVIKDGSRPIIAEIESLVSRTFLNYPARIGECMKREQLNTLVSIIEKRGKVSLYDKDVVLKTMGGLKIKDNAANLAIIVSLISSAIDKPVPPKTVFIGDVGLTGELKKAPSMELRIKEAERLGFETAYIAKGAGGKIQTKTIKIVEEEYLLQLISKIF